MTQIHEVPDGHRTLRVEGELLGTGSSRQGEAPRWTELALYRTTSGRYVLAGVGKSALPGETDRPWVKVATGPEAAIEILYRTDDDGVRYMTRAARTVTEAAVLLDERLANAWAVQVLD